MYWQSSVPTTMQRHQLADVPGAIEPAKVEAAPVRAGLSWEQLVEAVKPLAPSMATWRAFAPSFYIAFWTLTYADIHYPAALCVPLLENLPCKDPSICNSHWSCMGGARS